MNKIEKKISPELFEDVFDGRKSFELRKDEDEIKQGDWIVLREWDGERYTGREIEADVKYALRNGLTNGCCAISISVLEVRL